MLAALLFAAVQGVVAEDRAQFEKFWTENQELVSDIQLPKERAWILYEWTQAQFSLGYCSQFITADTAERARHIPDEDGALKSSKFGRWLLDQSNEAFRSGMAFRKEVRPTLKICETELRGRGETLEALANLKLTERPR